MEESKQKKREKREEKSKKSKKNKDKKHKRKKKKKKHKKHKKKHGGERSRRCDLCTRTHVCTQISLSRRGIRSDCQTIWW